MIIQDALIIGAILFLAGIAFVVARRLLERSLAPPSRSLAVQLEKDATITWPNRPQAPTPDLEERMDKSFEGMVQESGLGFNPGQVLGLCILTGISMAALLFFWSEDELAGAAGLALGVFIPLLVVAFYQRRRRNLLFSQLPDAFFFLARSLRAGLALEQGLTRAGEQLEEPLAGEFRRVASQIQLGLHPQKALQNMADRLRLPDFNVFVSTVSLAYQSGGNLALLLDRLAAATRDRIQFLGYFRAATALGRTAGFVLGAAVPALVIAYAILEPDHARDLFRTADGLQLLAIATVLEIIGVAWCFYLLRVDY